MDKKMLVINADEATDDMYLPAILKNPDGTYVAITPDGERQQCTDFDLASRIIYDDAWARNFQENGTIRNGELACRYTFKKIDRLDNDWLIGKYYSETGTEMGYAIYNTSTMTAYRSDSEVEMFFFFFVNSKQVAKDNSTHLDLMTKEGLLALYKFTNET